MTKPSPWYYAVNDRPVVIVQLPDGGSDCLVFDFTTGNLVPDRRYFAAVAPGSGKDVDMLTEGEFVRLVAARRTDVLWTWSERLCRATSGSVEDIIAALGSPLQPPPLGATRARVRGGEIASVELELPPETITRAALDVRFGASRALPRTGPFASHVLLYEVEVVGAPHRCSVFARFDGVPEPTASVTGVTLRLDRARA